jgi:hypothetical protein
MTRYTYRFWHPRYRDYVTLDCPAETKAAAMVSAVRFLRRENRRLHKATGGKWRVQLPRHESFMVVAVECAARELSTQEIERGTTK